MNMYEPRHVIPNNATFLQVKSRTSLCSLLLRLETTNDVRAVAQESQNIQATSKGSDQSARMRRLACRIYHIVWNLMVWLIFNESVH